jgi:hypothetical protein
MLQALAASRCDPLLTLRIETVTEASLDAIIARLQSCIVDAKALQLKMLERVLSIALLEAYENRERSRGRSNNGSS